MVGYLLSIDYEYKQLEMARFLIGFVLIAISFIVGRGVTLSMFSKMIGSHQAGVYMGYMLGIGAISRIVGPFWAVQCLEIGVYLTFGITAAAFFVAIICMLVYWKAMNPHWSYYINRQSQMVTMGGETDELHTPQYNDTGIAQALLFSMTPTSSATGTRRLRKNI